MKRILLVTLLLLPLAHAYAWSSPGHIIVAAEAYRELSPDLQKHVIDILKGHPDYSKWESSFTKNGDGLDFSTFVFMHAATWPDEIKGRDGPESQYDHPRWHYVEWPLIAPSFQIGPEPLPEDDALFGVAQCEKFIGDTNSSPELKAVGLSYLIHIIGDIHQPLHCCALFNSTYPKGDRGGADFYVVLGGKGVTLRSVWSGQFGRKINFKHQLAEAGRIVSEHPRKSLPELSAATTPKEWSLEGRQLALDEAYLHGNLKPGVSAEEATPLPDGYLKEAKAVADKQVALAGYRLADEIRKLK